MPKFLLNCPFWVFSLEMRLPSLKGAVGGPPNRAAPKGALVRT